MNESCKSIFFEDRQLSSNRSSIIKICDMFKHSKKILFITGAGISVSAGIPVSYLLYSLGLSIKRRNL